ncbi:hypothetical protein HK098_001985 [Nowakowskiella sp. JEL0407]|nr:hypothetical protein HK098_001985 [Nowakowskiella sp. JEL0407]
MSISKNSKLLAVLNYRLRITTSDSRILVGQMLAFDKHMNLVLGDCEEFRKVKNKGKSSAQQQTQEREEKRTLGLVVLRGEIIVSVSIESGPPVAEEQKLKAAMQNQSGGPGIGRSAGRGLPMGGMGVPAPGLTGPVPGIGGPASSIMAPRPGMSAPPVSYGRPPMPGQTPMPPMPSFPPGFRPPPGMPMPPPGFRPNIPPPGFNPAFRPLPPRPPQ